MSFIINPYLFGDPDVQAFISAAGITDSTQIQAINSLVIDLKGYGIWSKMKAIYPFVGGTASTHKFNLKDPRDLDAAFRLVFNGGWTHSSTGAKPNGTNGFADTKLNILNNLSLNNTHISIYSRTNKDALMCDIGGAVIGQESDIFSKLGNIFYPRCNSGSNAGVYNPVNSLGLFISNRIASTQVRSWRNNNLIVLNDNSTGLANSNIYIGCLGNDGNGTKSFFSDREQAFSSIGDGLSDTDAANLYTLVQNYQVALNRQV